MKKTLVTLLAVCMLLTVCTQALAADQLTWYMRGGNNEYEHYLAANTVGLQEIIKQANVKVEFTVVCGTNTEIDAQHLAMLASGNYPDVMMWMHNEAYVGGVSQMYNDGIIIELNDVIDQYMPNLKKILKENPDIDNAMKNDDGQYLFFSVICPMRETYDMYNITWYGPMLRQDWLDAVGEEVPATIDDWYRVLTAFKNYDPNVNGQQDEIPFDASSGRHSIFMGAYDLNNGIFLDPTTGKIGFGQYNARYRDYLETMQKWYAEGLIQNLFADENGGPVGSDVGDSNIYADLSGSWMGLSNFWEQRLPQLREKNPNASFVAAQWLEDAAGNTYSAYTNFGYFDRTITCITTDCENVEAAARLIDTMYAPENTDLLTWGVEDPDGENGTTGSYYVDENGVKHNTPWGLEKVDFYEGHFARRNLFAKSHIAFPRYGGFDYRAATYSAEFIQSADLWAKANHGLALPASLMLSADEQKAATSALDDMNAYINQMAYRFITGLEPLANFDTYIETLQKMGMDDYIAAYQAAYDRYIARGANNG